MSSAARGDLIGDAFNLDERAMRLAAGNERTDALYPHQDALGRELSKRTVCGHARDALGDDDLVLGRNAGSRQEFADGDAPEDAVLDSLIERRRRFRLRHRKARLNQRGDWRRCSRVGQCSIEMRRR